MSLDYSRLRCVSWPSICAAQVSGKMDIESMKNGMDLMEPRAVHPCCFAAMIPDQACPLTYADRALYCKFAGDRCRLSSLDDGIHHSQPPLAPLAAAWSSLVLAADATLCRLAGPEN